MRTRNLDEAIDAVSKVYCPRTVELTGRVRNTNAVPAVRHSASSQPLLELSCRAPVNIDAENSSRLFFMMNCARGSAAAIQQNRSADWRCGQAMHFSAGSMPNCRSTENLRRNLCGWISRSWKTIGALALPRDVSCAHVRGRIAPGRYC
jgi:hypothetical protein